MRTFEIPEFMKKMGVRFFSFILNIPINELDFSQKYISVNDLQYNVLQEFSSKCIQWRAECLSNNNVDILIDLSISNWLLGNQHIFNHWHVKTGGILYQPNIHNRFELSLAKLALEIYPVFLRKSLSETYYSEESLLAKLILNVGIIQELVCDREFSKLIIDKTKPDLEIRMDYYSATSGIRNGQIYAYKLINTLIMNSYVLMVMRGVISEESLMNILVEVINYFKELINGANEMELPIFIGFHNLGMPKDSILDTSLGKIRAYIPELCELLPAEIRPTLTSDGDYCGFILESTYKYKIKWYSDSERVKVHDEFEQVRTKVAEVQDKICYSATASSKSDSYIGVTPIWHKYFDIFSEARVLSWKSFYIESRPRPHILTSNEIIKFERHLKVLEEIDYKNIEIAVRRVNSALTERFNPVDGFIDSIIGWESLFGKRAELIMRISIALSKLLKSDEDERIQFQKKVKEYYNIRSDIVHGTKTLAYDQAIEKRNECLDILIQAIDCLLFDNKDLLSNKDRSTILALR